MVLCSIQNELHPKCAKNLTPREKGEVQKVKYPVVCIYYIDYAFKAQLLYNRENGNSIKCLLPQWD